VDIQHLVDRLEDLISNGRHVPLTPFTVVDEQRALELIDQMRISLPEEVEKAKRVLRERDRVVAQANEEAARIRELAKEKSETLVQRDSITQAAQSRAASVIAQSQREAEQVKREADQYVIEVLGELADALASTLSVVQNGMERVTGNHKRQRAASEEMETPSTLETSGEPMRIERIGPGKGQPSSS
jgi:hypothetical protein